MVYVADFSDDTSAFGQAWIDRVSESLNAEDQEKFKDCLSWLEPMLANQTLPTGESTIAHAQGVVSLLVQLRMDFTTMIAALVVAVPLLTTKVANVRFRQELEKRFDPEVIKLVEGLYQIVDFSNRSRESGRFDQLEEASQQEMLRKMVLAMATDLRIVLVRLCSRLQTLRWYAYIGEECPLDITLETRSVYAPLANRLGIYQIKWEMEDLIFRRLEPQKYHDIAKKLEGTRREREERVNRMVSDIRSALLDLDIAADVYGRAKHIWSIHNKMNNKHVGFERLFDLQALRIVVQTERECYTALSMVHTRWTPVIKEFDDYIARPKPNGYRSLHTVVRDADGFVYEVQIRTQEMDEFAEYGMAAHWRYKEAGSKGGKVSASSIYERQVSWMRQLIAWRQEVSEAQKAHIEDARAQEALAQKSQRLQDGEAQMQALQGGKSGRIYVLTPQARVIELAEGATPVDFAYALHTDLGHRCRGAKVNGHMVSLNTKLQTGQTVEIVAAKSGGPSRDWLNPELGYLASPRARSKVRQWFNAIALANRIVAGQAEVEKELQRLGKTATNMEHLAAKLGFAKAEDLYVAVAKDEVSLRAISHALTEPAEVPETHDEEEKRNMDRGNTRNSVIKTGKSGVLVVGVDSLMTQLAGCCHPAPPDLIGGFVTTGRGVSIHRHDCPSFSMLQRRHPERIIEVSWGESLPTAVYPINLVVRAQDRKDLLRDISEVFSRLKLNVIAVNTQTRQGNATMRFTVEVNNARHISQALVSLSEVKGVSQAQRV